MQITAISDTHNYHDALGTMSGETLVHAGDFTGCGKITELVDFVNWWAKQDFKHKILIAGNHEVSLDPDDRVFASILYTHSPDTHYLKDSAVTLNKTKFYGTPYQPWFCNWAFNLPVGGIELKEKWESVPSDTDVLITHCPPKGILDKTEAGVKAGCALLRAEIQRIAPKYHVFGHIHESYGSNLISGTNFVNASICDRAYRPVNKPVIFNI